MKRTILLFFVLSCTLSYAQQSVTIGGTGTNSKAVLWLVPTGGQGLLLPAVASASRTGMGLSTADAGMLVYDTGDKKIYYWDGSAWQSASGGSAQTLSYDASTRQLTLSAGGGTVTIAAQDLTKTGNTISLTGDATTVALANTAPTLAGQVLMWDAAAGNWTSSSATAPTNGQVLKWDDTAKRWKPDTDNAGTAPTVDNTSIGFNGSSQLEVKASGITDAKVATGISGSKITPNFGAQNIVTTGNMTAAAGTLSGNLNVRGLTYTWPSAQAAGVLTNNGTGTLTWTPGAAGTVTSVGLTLPAIFSVTGSPVTSSGTLTATLASQAAGTFLAAPAAAAGTPSFRALTTTDVPSLPISKLTGAGAGTRAILGSDNNTLSWVTGSPDQVLGTDAAGTLGFMNKSSFSFTTDNVVPKGSAAGLIASTIVDNGAYVGIGTATPTRKLDLDSQGDSYGFSHVNGTIRTSTYNGTLTGGGIGGSIGTESDHPFYIYVANGGEKATFLQNGNVGIGTNAPARRLEVKSTSFQAMRLSNTTSGPALEFVGTSDDWMISSWAGSFYFTHSTDDFASRSDQYQFTTTGFYSSQDNAKSLGSSSRRWTAVYAVNGTIQTSDSRLKQNIAPLKYGLDEVLKFKPVSYSWKSDPSSKKIGLIAQDIRTIVPEVVSDGEYLGMNYGELVPVLINAIQEQQKTIEKLEKEVGQLLTENQELQQLKTEMSAIRKMLEAQHDPMASRKK